MISGSGIRDQTQQIFAGSGIKILNVFWIRDQNFGQKYGISYEKIYLVTTLSLGHKRSYDSDYDSDSVASESQLDELVSEDKG